ncbi:unnamed protein product [Porites evermanni]|uniref:Uncharacterized protein n=1 Tax=Porites evermanni TaxID=104178 RepID=A0ABN8SFM2_9CNID|nr:unnamed protein product [Porites evermanni]
MFGALEIVGAKEEKQKERQTGEVVYYDWVGLLNDGILSKQTGAVVDKYVQYHHPLKKDKLIEVQRNIISN